MPAAYGRGIGLKMSPRQRNPAVVHRFYDQRRSDLPHRQPNAAHKALARLQQHCLDEISEAISSADIFAAIGTSSAF